MALEKALLDFVHKPKKFQCLPALSRPSSSAEQGQSKIRQAFLDVPMYYQHENLTKIADEAGIKVQDLKPGDFVLFMASNWEALKLLGPQGVLVYLRAPRGRRISHLFLRELPKLFNASRPIKYDEALKPLLEKFLAEKARRPRQVSK